MWDSFVRSGVGAASARNDECKEFRHVYVYRISSVIATLHSCASVRDGVKVAAIGEHLYPLGDGPLNRGQLQLAEMWLAHISERYGLTRRIQSWLI